MRLATSTEIDASAQTVWACIDEPDKIVKWVEGAVEHRYLTERDPENPVGQRFLQRVKMGPNVKQFEGTLINFEHLRHFAFTIPSPAYSSEAHFRLTEIAPQKTRVEYSIDVTLHTLAAKLGGPLLRVPLIFFVRKQMARLKSLAQSGATV